MMCLLSQFLTDGDRDVKRTRPKSDSEQAFAK
jgi:hypothetical protein